MNIKLELGHKKKDGSARVYIRVTAQCERKRIPTNVYLDSNEYAKTKSGFRIKTLEKQAILEKLIADTKKTLTEDDNIIREVTADDLANIVKDSRRYGDFFQYANNWISTCTKKGKKNYVTAINNFYAFVGSPLPFDRLTVNLLQAYEDSLADRPRAQSMYIGSIRHIWNEAEKELDKLPKSPFIRYSAPKQKARAKKERAVDISTIQKIYKYNGEGRAELARDCFILSFAFMGMNAADLYSCTDVNDGVLAYDRVKVRDRRPDAHTEIDIPDFVLPLMIKYKGKKTVFDFCSRFSTEANFVRSLNIGLKAILGEDTEVTFYSARHAWASIARNQCGIDKYTINEALVHKDRDMAITDLYIKKDYKLINKANKKVMRKVFGV